MARAFRNRIAFPYGAFPATPSYDALRMLAW